MRPLAIDLYCGLGGWTDGLLAEGFRVVGFDIERHRYPKFKNPPEFGGTKLPAGNSTSSKWSERPITRISDLGDKAEWIEGEWMEYPGQLVIQDVLTLHGSQFRDAAVIVASPPCQEYSYMAMPWKRAKAKAAAIRADESGKMLEDLNRLFNACFRIQREACEASGRHIPLIVENVRGAQPWVGRARWSYGSFFLWGDVPALMPVTLGRAVMKAGIAHRSNGATNFHGTKNDGSGWRENGTLASCNRMVPDGRKGEGSWFGDYQTMKEGVKQGGDWFNASQPSISRMCSSKSPARKAASAMIAKIPLPLSRHIARTFKPQLEHRIAA